MSRQKLCAVPPVFLERAPSFPARMISPFRKKKRGGERIQDGRTSREPNYFFPFASNCCIWRLGRKQVGHVFMGSENNLRTSRIRGANDICTENGVNQLAVVEYLDRL